MGAWSAGLINAMIDGVVTWLTASTMAALNWVLSLLSNTVFTSPDVTGLPQVSFMSRRALLAANACLALIVTVVGFLAMTHGTVQDRYSLKELLPRMLIGFAAANLSTPILSTAITAANALTAALTGDPLSSPDSFAQIKRIITDVAGNPEQLLVALVLRELAVVLLVLLVISWLGRLSVLIVAGAVAPIALLCHALPQTDPVARTWWRALGGCLLIQVLQAVALRTAVATLLSGEASLPALGLPHDPSGLFNLLMTCFLLWLVIRIPKWVSRSFGGNAGRATSMLASIARVVVVQQVLGAVGLRGGKAFGRGRSPARTAARGAASAAPRPPSGPRPPASHFHQHTNTHEHIHLHAPGDQRRSRPDQSSRGGRAQGSRPGADRGSRAPRGAYWAGDITPQPRAHPGRPPRALEARRAIGAGPQHSAPSNPGPHNPGPHKPGSRPPGSPPPRPPRPPG